jgi:hypothetical protein
MNKKQLAKLLIKHPEIKSLYESQAFDTSTINKVIAEEIMNEQDAEDPIEQAFGKKLADMTDGEKKDALESLRFQRSGIRETMKSIQADIKEFGEDEELASEMAETKEKAKRIGDLIKSLTKSIDSASAKALQNSEQQAVTRASDAVETMKATADQLKDATPILNDENTTPDLAAKVVDITHDNIEKIANIANNLDSSMETQPETELGDIEDADGGNDTSSQGSTEVDQEEIKRKVDRAINAISRSFTISDYPNDLSGFLDKEDVEAGGRNGDLIAVNIDQKSSKAILLCYLISRVAGGSDGNAIAAFAQNGFPIMSPSPLGLTPAKYSEALSKLGLTTSEAKEIFKGAQMPLSSALKALMKSNQRGGKGKFKNEVHQKQMVMLPFVRKFTADSSISEIITSATSESTQQTGSSPAPEATEEPSPQPPTKKGIKIAQGAIRGRDVDTSEVTPEEVRSAIEQDREEISSNPEMRDNAEELAQKVQATELPADNEEVIRDLNNEIESFKAMLENPEEWELTDADVEEVKQGIADRTAELEKLGVAVAKTDSKEDDQAVTQALQAAEPEIQQAKTSNDGKPDMAALDAAIMNALQNAQSGAKEANSELDLSDIEIVDDDDNIEATPEGTQEAVEAIQNEVPENVDNIEPADVEEAEEQLETEIEASQEMQTNAEELKNKVEKKKMAQQPPKASSVSKRFKTLFNQAGQKLEELKREAVDAFADPENKSKIVSNVSELMQSAYGEFNSFYTTIENAGNWEGILESGLFKFKQPPEDLDFNGWKDSVMKKITPTYQNVQDQLKKLSELDAQELSVDGLGEITGNFGSTAQDIITTTDEIENNIAGDDTSSGDVGGAEVQGQTDLETISKILPELKDKLPNLFKFDGFVKNLAQALMNAEAGPDSDSTNDTDDADDAQGGETVLGTNLDSNAAAIDSEDDVQGIPEALSGIYLTEEEGVVDDTDEAGDEKTGKPLEVADAETLKKELEQLRQVLEPKNIKIEDLLTPELKQALGQEPTEETSEVPSVEEAAEEGQNAAQDDAELPDMKYQEMYAGFKEQMDEFFSLDGKNDGFMDQFLLKYQAKALSELLGTLDDIIRGDVPKDGEDNEGEARALSTATQQADNQLEEAQEQEISEKGQLELKTRLIAMLKGLKSLKAMMNSYKQNATRSSANPKLDGSALKKSLQRYMSNLQINIKAIVETCYIEHSKLTQTQSDDVDLNEPSGDDATQPTGDDTTQNVEDPQPSVQSEQLYEAILEAIAPALDGVYLMEDAAREEKMAIVNQTYEAMSKIYEGSMQSALERSQKAIAMKNAKDMMELAKKEEFVALFPTFVGSFGGKPQTINQATDAVEGLLKDFVETMKKVIVLAKGSTIDETTLSKVIEDLSLMSLAMQNYFGVKSLLDDDMQARVEKMLAQRAENQSLSDEAKPSNERSGGLLGKALVGCTAKSPSSCF